MVEAGIGGGKGGGGRGAELGGIGGGGLGSSELVAIPAGDTSPSLRGNIGNQKQFFTPAAGLSFLAAWAGVGSLCRFASRGRHT